MEYLTVTHNPGADGTLVGLPGQQGTLYSWMRVLAGGGSSQFSEIQMRGPIYDKLGVEILGGGGGGGSLSTLSDVTIGVPSPPLAPLANGDILYYFAGLNKWVNAPSASIFPIPALSQLPDVDISGTPSDRQGLVYDASLNAWSNTVRRYEFLSVSNNAVTTASGDPVNAALSAITSNGVILNLSATKIEGSFNTVGVYHYNIFLETDSSSNSELTLQFQVDTGLGFLGYGAPMRQTTKNTERLQFLLCGIVSLPSVSGSSFRVLYTAVPPNPTLFSNVQFTIHEV